MRPLSMLVILALHLGCGAPRSAARPPGAAAFASLPARELSEEQAREALWRPDLRPGWRDPSAAETAAIEALIPALLSAARNGELPDTAVALAATVDLVIERWRVAGADHLALIEAPEARRGAGAYLFAVGRTAPAAGPWVLLEAPHAYYDLNTGQIAAHLYLAPPQGAAPLAFFTGSLHRFTRPDGSRDRGASNPADAAHNPAHLLAVATRAAAEARPGATVVQIHGFAAADDEGDPPTGTLAVLSGGVEAPTALARAVTERLEVLFGAEPVRLYPSEVTVLGGTTNAELAALAGAPRARFLHIELSSSLRAGLIAQPDRLSAFSTAVLAPASTP